MKIFFNLGASSCSYSHFVLENCQHQHHTIPGEKTQIFKDEHFHGRRLLIIFFAFWDLKKRMTILYFITSIKKDSTVIGKGMSLLGFRRFTLSFFLNIFVINITVRIQHYWLYSDSLTLLPLMMPRPPAHSAL